MRSNIHRFYVPSYTYKVKSGRHTKTFKIKAHIQKRKVTLRTLKKNYRYDKKLRAYRKRKRMLYCLYFFTLRMESDVFFTNAKYQITSSERYALHKALTNPEISFFLTADNVTLYSILYLKKYYTIKPYVKIWNAERYNVFSSDTGEYEYDVFIHYLDKKYGIKEVRLPAKYKEALRSMFNTGFESSRQSGLR